MAGFVGVHKLQGYSLYSYILPANLGQMNINRNIITDYIFAMQFKFSFVFANNGMKFQYLFHPLYFCFVEFIMGFRFTLVKFVSSDQVCYDSCCDLPQISLWILSQSEFKGRVCSGVITEMCPRVCRSFHCIFFQRSANQFFRPIQS